MRVLAAILVLVLALLLSYALWTVYENTLTTAALNEGPPITATTSGASALSATAARALKAYGGEAVWKDAVTVESTVTVGGLLSAEGGQHSSAREDHRRRSASPYGDRSRRRSGRHRGARWVQRDDPVA